jgi:hypothetical protein
MEIFRILGAGNLKTLKISVPKLFFLEKISDEDFLCEI